MMDIETRKLKIDQQITEAAQNCGRNPAEIRLLAVSKTKPVEEIRKLASLGQRDFGESYLQEAKDKIPQMAGLGILWHFIGQLQRNKTGVVAELFDWVQSIDRLVIAERLSAQRPAHLPDLNVCLQVRMSDEPGKGGLQPDEVPGLAQSILHLPRLKLRGLMTIPEHTTDTGTQRRAFRRMHELYLSLQARHPMVDTLSMGMSGDFQLAIEEGSTMVRIGTALFGKRR